MERVPLKTRDTISLKNIDRDELLTLEITSEPLGFGASSIAYNAQTNNGFVCKYRVKELYPININGISRGTDNNLVISGEAAAEYQRAKERFNRAAELLNEFAYADDTGIYTVKPHGRFEAVTENENKAIYLVTEWLPGDYVDALGICGGNDLDSAVTICKKVTEAAALFHQKGYFNLDIKPENILYSPQTGNISFFDTDSILKLGDPFAENSYGSDGVAPEIRNGFTHLFSEKADVYSIGSMLHRFITKKNYYSGQYTKKAGKKFSSFENYEMCKKGNPWIIAIIQDIFEQCNPGVPARRCSTDELYKMLDRLSELTDPKAVYALNSYIPQTNGLEIYSDEVYRLHKMLRNERYAVIQGLHNSGKSTFARYYANERKSCYHTVIWADYSGDLKDTVAAIPFNGIADDEFSKEKLFDMKYRSLQKYDRETLLIIDGMDEPDQFVEELLNNLDVNIIITTALNSPFERRHIYKLSSEQEFMFSTSEMADFCNKMRTLHQNDSILLYVYYIIFTLFMGLLAFLAFVIRDYSVLFSVIMAISVIAMIVFKSLILKKTENCAITKMRIVNCKDHFKAAYDFSNSVNNQQVFEITAPDFIAESEKKRHDARIKLGIAAIAAGVVSLVLSIILNSFPLLVALGTGIMACIFAADYRLGFKIAADMYNSKFGSPELSGRRDIKEIYSFRDKSNTPAKDNISTECIRQILYSEYKIRCDGWGIVDAVTKIVAVVSIAALLLNSIDIPKASYFCIPDNIPENTFNYICIFVYCALSTYTVLKSKEFYKVVKDILFTIYTGNSKFINQKFKAYADENYVSELAKARGIYDFSLLQFEQEIPIYEIEKSERPTFKHYCTTQNVRMLTYFNLLTLSAVCFVVWHFGIVSDLIPLLAASLVFQVIWFAWGKYPFNRRVLKISKIKVKSSSK